MRICTNFACWSFIGAAGSSPLRRCYSTRNNNLVMMMAPVPAAGVATNTVPLSLTLVDTHEIVEEVKNSKFIAKASHVRSIEEALSFVKKVSEDKASHNCWAYKSSQNYERFSDDGEPGGTAGRPILAAIEAERVVDVVVVVVRYFGGTKLGTGGLIRAYGNAARVCIRDAAKVTIIPTTVLRIVLPCAELGIAYQAMNSCAPMAERVSEDNSGDDIVALTIKLPTAVVDDLTSRLIDTSKGTASVSVVDS